MQIKHKWHHHQQVQQVEKTKLEECFENLGTGASDKGVIEKIILITDDGCRLENLGTINPAFVVILFFYCFSVLVCFFIVVF